MTDDSQKKSPQQADVQKASMLFLDDVRTSYNGIRAVRGVSLTIERGSIVALIGPNGAGKSSLMNTLSGLVRRESGSIWLKGENISRRQAHEIARRGMLQVPEGRQILATLSVRENLLLGALAAGSRKQAHTLDQVFNLFPVLKERSGQLGGSLSGGQQQMLAIGRALMGLPEVLLLDEPSLGLAPMAIRQVFDALRKLNEDGLTIFLVEQNAKFALEYTDYAYVMEQGKIVQQGQSEELVNHPDVVKHYLGVA